MNVFGKRLVAWFIDIMVCCFLFFSISFFLNSSFGVFSAWQYAFFFIPYFLRDITFGNSSIGKKILGLSIIDHTDWSAPKRIFLFKRALLSNTVGYCVLWKGLFVGNNGIINLFSWERQTIGTYVIERKVFLEIQQKAPKESCNRYIAMDQLYSDYLCSIYGTSKKD